MGSDGTVGDRVGEGIERLEERFGSFPINQTTLSVSEADYETACARADAGKTDAYVRVHNDEGDVLRLCNDREYDVPRCVNDPAEPLAVSVARTVRKEANVECTIDDVARVTIAGVNNEADPDSPTAYRLITLLDAAYVQGRLVDAVWDSGEPVIPEYV